MEGAKRAVGTLRVRTSSVAISSTRPSVYDKGGVVLHCPACPGRHALLRLASIITSWILAARYATAVTEDFRAACERTTGKDLGYFFDEWVDGEGYPLYEYSWNTLATAGGFETTVRVEQRVKSTPPAFFTMPLDCRFSASGWDTTIVVRNNAASQQFTLLLSHQPDSLRLDPGEWVLGEFTNLNEMGLVPATSLSCRTIQILSTRRRSSVSTLQAGHVSLKVYDLLGREVATLSKVKCHPGVIRRSGTAPRTRANRSHQEFICTGFSPGDSRLPGLCYCSNETPVASLSHLSIFSANLLTKIRTPCCLTRLLLLAAFPLLPSILPAQPSYLPPKREVRAVWLATTAGLDWPKTCGYR